MIDIPHSNETNWEQGPCWNGVEGERSVILTCPNGHRLTLFNPAQKAPRHGIAEDGTVDGSVVCQGRPTDPCGWHEHVRLLDWDGGAIARI